MLYRQTADGAVAVDLDTELRFMERLFRGAAATTEAEIGAPPTSDPAASASDVAVFDAWRTLLSGDPDLVRDARMMVPVYYDVEREKTKVWVFLGWDTRPLSITYETPPRVVSSRPLWPDGRGRPEVEFPGQYTRVTTPIMAEVYVTRLLDRKAFRAHCDRYKTRSAILEHLR